MALSPLFILIVFIVVFTVYSVDKTESEPNLALSVAAVEYMKVTPYLVVPATAVAGMDVMAVLTLGLALCGPTGITDGDYNVYGWFVASLLSIAFRYPKKYS